MILIPIRTDRRLKHLPLVNAGLIVVNFAVFLYVTSRAQDQAFQLQIAERFYLSPTAPRLIQFITYQFLHAGWMHLLGNMLFLYVFGNSVEDRLGKIGYLAFYLAGGILAGLGHSLVDSNPVLGASGSIAAVTGAYLALFPASNVTIGYFFFFIGMFEISSVYLILFQIGENLVMVLNQAVLRGGGGVAYLAHLAGYAYGFLVGMSLLWTRLLPCEPYDLLSMLEHRRRRMQFANLTRKGYQPWEAAPAGSTPLGSGGVGTDSGADASGVVVDLRSRISKALALHHTAEAAGLYRQLLNADEAQVLPAQSQLDIANQFATEGDYDLAARAYELYLGAFRSDGQRDQVEPILALIYARYLHRFQRARELLITCLPRLQDQQLKNLAQQTLTQINT